MGRARRPETRASSKEQEAAEALTCLAAASREAQQDSESIGSSDEEESAASSRERLRPNAWQSYKEVDPTQPDGCGSRFKVFCHIVRRKRTWTFLRP